MTADANQPALDDLFFKALVDGYITNPRFIRRDWLSQEVEKRIQEPGCRFVLLTAEPGAGKSAFMAQLAADNPDWARYFIRRDQRTPLADVGVHSFLLRIGYQLAARFPELFAQEQLKIAIEQRIGTVEGDGEVIGAEVKRILASPFYTKVLQIQQHIERNKGKVIALRVEELVIEPRLIDPKDLQYMALIDPASALLKREPEKQIVVLVDALDEIWYHATEGTLLRWLIDCPELPENVRFILTSRPHEGEVVTFREKKEAYIKPLTIESKDHRVHKEMRAYIEKLLGIPEVNTVLSTTAKGVEDFSKEAVEKADGNIGYLDAIARGIDQALSVKEKKEAEGISLLKGLLSLKVLPKDTQELNGLFLHQIKNRPSVKDRSIRVRDESTGKDHFLSMWTEVYKPVLGVLSVAFEPLAVDQIRALGGIAGSRDDVIEAKGWLRQFLDEEGGRCRFYHATMPEFLVASATRQNPQYEDLAVDPALWHGRVVASYRGQAATWDRVDWSKVDDYGLLNLATHLYALREEPECRSQLHGLICKPFMEKKLSRFQSHSSFYKDVDLAIQVAADDESPEGLVQLVRDCLICGTLVSMATDVSSQVLAEWVHAGQEMRAMEYASLIPNSSTRSQAFQAISEALLGIGRIDHARVALKQAISAANTIEDSSGKAYALKSISRVLVQAGLFDEACVIGMTPNIHAWDQSEILCHISHRLNELRQAERANVVAQQAITIVADVREEEWKDEGVRRTAVALAHAGLFGMDLKAARMIANDLMKTIALDTIALSRAHAGRVQEAAAIAYEAQGVARSTRHPWAKPQAIADSAFTLARLGAGGLAQTMAEEAITAARDTGTLSSPHLLKEIITIWDHESLLDQAYRAAQLIPEESQYHSEEKALSLSQIALRKSHLGDKDGAAAVARVALATVKRISREDSKSQTMSRVAANCAECGLAELGHKEVQGDKKRGSQEATHQDAAEKRKQISESFEEAEALSGITWALAQIKHSEQVSIVAKHARAVARQIGDDRERSFVISLVAVSLAQVDSCEEALSTIDSIIDDDFKTAVLAMIAPMLAAQMDARAIRTIIHNIANPGNKAKAAAHWAYSLAQAGMTDMAEIMTYDCLAATRSIHPPEFKSEVVDSLFSAINQVDDIEGTIKDVRPVLDLRVMYEPEKWTFILSQVACRLAEAAQNEKARLVASETIRAAIRMRCAGAGETRMLAQSYWFERDRQEKALKWLQDNVPLACVRGRQAVFGVLGREGLLALAVLDQGKTLWGIYEAIQDVDRWWNVK